MNRYGALSTSDAASSEGEKDLHLWIPKVLASFCEGGKDAVATGTLREEPTELAVVESSNLEGGKDVLATGTQREIPTELAVVKSSKLEFAINAESIRFIAYLFFWSMCFFAIAMTRFVVAPLLLEGPADGNTCPPFQITYEDDNVTVLHDKSHGFDVLTNSHLQDAFGFGNICTNWDYSPSRELTAMVYPLFEYSLLLYIILDFLVSAISYKKGYLSERYWTVTKTIFPFLLVLCAWFRMIFVVEAYSNVQGHTAGFLGLQIALATVAILNTAYVLETGTSYSVLGELKGTRITAYAYIITDLIISGIKVYLSAFIVFGWGLEHGNIYPKFALESAWPGSSLVIGQVVDIIWMIFNAIFPLIISFIRSRSEPSLKFTIDL